MLIVLAVLGVIVAFAVIALGGSTDIIERQTVAKQFKVALERARFDSVKRRPATCEDMSRVEILSQTSFQYITDLNQNGTLETASEYQVVSFANRGGGIKVLETTFPIIIRFDRRGNTFSGNCGSEVPAATPTTFCQMPCSAATATNSTSVYVSPTGTVSILPFGTGNPTFDPPSITTISPDAGINDDLAVWYGTPPTPTPVASPITSPEPTATPETTPSPDPSATPSETPDISPSPSPSATPEPLPACTKNQKPGTPPTCSCNPPFFVQGNGMCK